jgi:hypothetical protein
MVFAAIAIMAAITLIGFSSQAHQRISITDDLALNAKDNALMSAFGAPLVSPSIVGKDTWSCAQSFKRNPAAGVTVVLDPKLASSWSLPKACGV